MIHMGRYHTRTSKHYIDPEEAKAKHPQRRKRQISSSQPELKLSKRSKNCPPLFPVRHEQLLLLPFRVEICLSTTPTLLCH